ncbi:hypothetical protein M406DRAFT_335102 [Cryphonectria parasitica EP155]|uniref:Uncharacterized protein n=1 Tax=Cryphonectria parasitica (strain ATCC 38755 / EP155) TaxID=660469 RepID=A0A9P4XRU6_CRYP1|nr:uncharacterized protein M406DRAFT_335102 [Cryphonectria parasitica EP155]KAF3759886.1 hypothetical protein M406DRAFT_335102 [Cryphonectria parasitica EP155]
MSEYTSTIEGFQRAMEWSLAGPPEESKLYAEATVTPTFYQIVNGHQLSYNVFLKSIEEWRAKVTSYRPKVHEFLRDGNQLAARLVGTIEVDGATTEYESFMFAKINKDNGKMEYLIERSVMGPVTQGPEHSAKE